MPRGSLDWLSMLIDFSLPSKVGHGKTLLGTLRYSSLNEVFSANPTSPTEERETMGLAAILTSHHVGHSESPSVSLAAPIDHEPLSDSKGSTSLEIKFLGAQFLRISCIASISLSHSWPYSVVCNGIERLKKHTLMGF